MELEYWVSRQQPLREQLLRKQKKIEKKIVEFFLKKRGKKVKIVKEQLNNAFMS